MPMKPSGKAISRSLGKRHNNAVNNPIKIDAVPNAFIFCSMFIMLQYPFKFTNFRNISRFFLKAFIGLIKY